MRFGFVALALIGACASAAAPPAIPPLTSVDAVDPPAKASASAAPIEPPSAPAAEIPDDVRALQEDILKHGHAYEIVRSLTDEVGPRPAGSRGDKEAVAWAQRTLAAQGFANVHAEPVKVRHWERGVETAEIVAPIAHALRVTALGGSAATPAHGIDAEIVEVESYEALQALADSRSLAGKIAFINQRTSRARDGSGYGKAVLGRYLGPRAAHKAGAVALLVRSIGTDDNRLPHTGASARDPNGIPAAAVAAPDADLLHRLLEAHKSPRVRVTLTPRELPPADSANVVGEIRGEGKPDEIVLLGAHLDSWDLGTGAIDDGAGCAIAIDAARAIGALRARPRRTIRVVLFANEENGREGGDEYAKRHAAEADKHVVALEADLGGDRAYQYRVKGSSDAPAKMERFAPWLAPIGVTWSATDAWGGTDIDPLGALGVPLMDASQDATRYFDWHHSENDTFDKIDAEAIAQATAAVATLAWATASMDGDLGRIPQEKRERPRRK